MEIFTLSLLQCSKSKSLTAFSYRTIVNVYDNDILSVKRLTVFQKNGFYLIPFWVGINSKINPCMERWEKMYFLWSSKPGKWTKNCQLYVL